MHTLLLLAVVGASDLRPNEAKDFSSAEKIQRHLEQRERELRAVDASALPAAQRESRAALLDRLHVYSQRGVFPHNHSLPGEQRPFFIDDHGTACAVGQLIIDSGHRELSERIRAEDNNGYLLELRVDGLDAWVASSGFTAMELAGIQPGYTYYATQEGRVGVLKDGKVKFTSYVLDELQAFEFQFATNHVAHAGETVYLEGSSRRAARVVGAKLQFLETNATAGAPRQAGSSVMVMGLATLDFYDATGTKTVLDLSGLPSGKYLLDADARDPKDVFLVDNSGTLFHSDGTALTSVASEASFATKGARLTVLDDVWLVSDGHLWRLVGDKLVAVALPSGAAPVSIFGRGASVYLAGPGPLLAWDGTAFAAVDGAGTDLLAGAVASDGTITAVGKKGAIAQGKAGGAWTKLTAPTAASLTVAAPLEDGSVLLGVDPTECRSAVDDGCPVAPKPVSRGEGCSSAPGSLSLMLAALAVLAARRRLAVSKAR